MSLGLKAVVILCCVGCSLQFLGDLSKPIMLSVDLPELLATPASATAETVQAQPQPHDDATTSDCAPAVTTAKGSSTCRGQLIFEDNFNIIDSKKWRKECRLTSDEGDHEFVAYEQHEENAYIRDGHLHILPTLLTNPRDPDYIQSGFLNMSHQCDCVQSSGTICARQAESFNILPPVVSASFKTKDFSFKYGRVEIRAKLPKGDWLYPRLHLEPVNPSYGRGFRSGIMRVAFARGNVVLSSSGKLIDGRELSGGMILAQFPPVRDAYSRRYHGNTQWSDAFHTYELLWMPDKVQMKVDGTLYGTVAAPANGFKSLADTAKNMEYASGWIGETMSPFDQEFGLTLGLGCGGVTNFPDDAVTNDADGNDHTKPWRNKSPKGMLNFWEDLPNWISTWQGEEAALQIDYVRVYAL